MHILNGSTISNFNGNFTRNHHIENADAEGTRIQNGLPPARLWKTEKVSFPL